MMYCNNGVIQTNEESVFFPNYKKYLQNKKQYAEYKLLASAEIQIKDMLYIELEEI